MKFPTRILWGGIRVMVLFMAFACAFNQLAHAQTTDENISLTITDRNGQALPYATVIVESAGLTYTADAQGRLRLKPTLFTTKGKAARWQQQDKEEQRMNKTEFIKVRCTLEEKQRIKSKAESAGRKFSDYCREILLNGEVVAVPKMTDNEREAIAILQHTGRFYGQVSNLIKVKDEDWLHITKNLSLCAKEAFKRFYDPHFRVDDEIYKVLNMSRDDRKM